jgi:hypothetical protein
MCVYEGLAGEEPVLGVLSVGLSELLPDDVAALDEAY